MKNPAKKMYSKQCALLAKISAESATSDLGTNRIRGICLTTEFFIIEMHRENIELLKGARRA